MKITRSGLFMSVVGLAAALGAPVLGFRQAPQPTKAEAREIANRDVVPTTQGVVPTAAQAPFFLPAKFSRFYRSSHPIWVGVQKRGNRRNRSRFNYNR